MAALTAYGAAYIAEGTGGLPTTLYLQFHSGDPTDAGTANIGGGTTRVSLTMADSGTDGQVWNTNATTYSAYPSSENLTYCSLWDAASAGNCWVVGALSSTLTTVGGSDITIAANQVVVTFPSY